MTVWYVYHTRHRLNLVQARCVFCDLHISLGEQIPLRYTLASG